MFSDLIKAFFSFGVLIALIILAQSYQQSLFDWSLEKIPELQADASIFKENAWSFYSNYGLAAIIILPFALTYLLIEERSRCFYYLFFIVGSEAVANVIKLANHAPRPYWVSPEIRAFNCSNQYGDPSGHSMTSMGILMSLWFDFVNSQSS